MFKRELVIAVAFDYGFDKSKAFSHNPEKLLKTHISLCLTLLACLTASNVLHISE